MHKQEEFVVLLALEHTHTQTQTQARIQRLIEQTVADNYASYRRFSHSGH